MMSGVFDSGIGGMSVIFELRKFRPRADLIYYADKKNCPYGTKSRQEIIRLVRADIARLREAGATHALIACCTASTVYCSLTPAEQKFLTPILAPRQTTAAAVSSQELSNASMFIFGILFSECAFALSCEARHDDGVLVYYPLRGLCTVVSAADADLGEAVGAVEGYCRRI